MKYPKVSIIILNWNGWKDTIECLESVFQNTYPNYEVIVVDNGSEDNSVEMIKKWADGKEEIASPYFTYSNKNKPISYFEYTKEDSETGEYLNGKEKLDLLPSDRKLFILKNDKNYGFAEGNNIAIKQIYKNKSDYILLLNNDTVVNKKFLNGLIETAKKNKIIKVVGSRIDFYDKPGEIWFSGGYFNIFKFPGYFHFKKLLDEKNSYKVDFVSGCSMLVKVDHVMKNNLLPECYFFGCEDAEYCLEVKKSGKLSIVEPKSIIYHKVSRSQKTSFKKLQNLLFTNLKFLWRNNPWLIMISPKIGLEILIYFLNRVSKKLINKIAQRYSN